jgi:hypothetical protein
MKVTAKNVLMLMSLMAGACFTSIDATKLRFVKVGTVDRQIKATQQKTGHLPSPTSPPKSLGLFAADQVRLTECRNIWRIL